jgi:[ribosomal protein S18]-alanine N-acetyltransferase
LDSGVGFLKRKVSVETQVHIRWMIRRDLPEVLVIERESFEFPWFEQEFIRCLRQRNCIGMVAEAKVIGAQWPIVGFIVYELHRSRIHILNVAVAEAFRHQKVGSQIVRKMVGKLSPQRRTRITLEIRETNLAAQMFFRLHGFKATTVLSDFYDDSTEDAYLFQFRTEETSEPDCINALMDDLCYGT